MPYLILLLLFLQIPKESPKQLGKFDEGKPASPKSLKSVGVRGTVDGGGYAASAAAKTQSELYRQLVDLQVSLTHPLWKSSLPCPSAIPELERRPHSPETRQLLGLAYEANGQLEAAAEQFRLATDVRDDEIARFLYGSALLLVGDTPRADSVFAKAGSPPSLTTVGEAAARFQEGDVDQSLRLFLKSNHPAAALFIAIVVRSASPAARSEAITALAQKTPGNATALYALACARLSANENDPAKIESEWKQSIALDPNLAGAHFRLAASYASRGELTPAITEYRSALAIDPEMADAHYRLSQLYTRSGDTAAAKEQLNLHQQTRTRQQAEIESGKVRLRFPGVPPLTCPNN